MSKEVIGMQIKFFLVFPIIFLLGCTTNKVTVKGIARDHLGRPVTRAQIKITDIEQCCSGEDKPCSYVTDASGNWNLFFVTGKVNAYVENAHKSCAYTASASGFATAQGNWTYCIRGSCSGNQFINTVITLVPIVPERRK